jgi:hypothetical protein
MVFLQERQKPGKELAGLFEVRDVAPVGYHHSRGMGMSRAAAAESAVK